MQSVPIPRKLSLKHLVLPFSIIIIELICCFLSISIDFYTIVFYVALPPDDCSSETCNSNGICDAEPSGVGDSGVTDGNFLCLCDCNVAGTDCDGKTLQICTSMATCMSTDALQKPFTVVDREPSSGVTKIRSCYATSGLKQHFKASLVRSLKVGPQSNVFWKIVWKDYVEDGPVLQGLTPKSTSAHSCMLQCPPLSHS